MYGKVKLFLYDYESVYCSRGIAQLIHDSGTRLWSEVSRPWPLYLPGKGSLYPFNTRLNETRCRFG